MDTQNLDKPKRPYDILNLKYLTKKRVDEIYYRLKIKMKYKSYDDFMNHLLDFLEKNLNNFEQS